jgi:hypothetical protein
MPNREEQNTEFFEAAKNGDKPKLEQFLDAGININSKDKVRQQ